MFILPIGPKPDWRRPPLVTLLLVLVNCLIFFGPQRHDGDIVEQAARYYERAGLALVEFPRYGDFLAAAGRTEDAAVFADMLEAEAFFPALMALQHDRAFLATLHANGLGAGDEVDVERWREQRTEFERQWESQTTERYAFDTAGPRWYQFVGHMFLHGSLGHLLGNMMVLVAMGYIVERLLGSARYLAFYLVGGLGAVALYWLTAGDDGQLVGASGAIAAVMGMYAVLLGVRRIEFFYSLLFYFDIARAPAIVLLPVWVANEFYQLWTLPYSRVAYLAHVGGLLSGAALVFLFGRGARAAIAAEVPAADAEAERAQAFADAESLLQKLQFDAARKAWGRLARRYPEDRRALSQYLTMTRATPADDDYHQAAALILALADTDPATIALQAETYAEYVRIARPIRLGVARSLMLAERFALHQRPHEAAQLVRALLRGDATDEARLAALMLQVSKAFRAYGDAARAQEWADALVERFPSSSQAELMRAVLTR